MKEDAMIEPIEWSGLNNRVKLTRLWFFRHFYDQITGFYDISSVKYIKKLYKAFQTCMQINISCFPPYVNNIIIQKNCRKRIITW
jgi:hypothetical protein